MHLLREQQQDELKAYLRRTGLLGPCMWFRAAVSPVNVGDHGSQSISSLFTCSPLQQQN